MLDAVVDLLEAGDATPTAQELAAHAGVSQASVFRYFATIDDLQREAIGRFFDRNAALFQIPDAGAAGYAANRVALCEALEPMARMVRARGAGDPVLHDVRRRLADQAAEHFAPELRRMTRAGRADAVAMIATITSFESWDQLRHDFDRTPMQIRRAWTAAIVATLR